MVRERRPGEPVHGSHEAATRFIQQTKGFELTEGERSADRLPHETLRRFCRWKDPEGDDDDARYHDLLHAITCWIEGAGEQGAG